MAAGLAAVLMAGAVLPDAAWAQRRGEETTAEGRVLSAKVGTEMQKALEALQTDNYAGSLASLQKILAMPDLTPYEKGVTLQMQGQAYFGLEQIRNAIGAWERAINEGDLLPNERRGLRVNVGQLWIAEGDYVRGAQVLEQAKNEGADLDEKIEFMLATAWAQAANDSSGSTADNYYRKALGYAESAFRQINPKERKHYDLLNFLYNTLKMYGKQADLVTEMISLYPTDRQLFISLASLYSNADKTKEAFEVNKLMYLNGWLDKEEQILRLVQYYSALEVPFEGAKILEREMNAGRVSKSVKNLEELANLLRQAREYERAIPILTQAADQKSDGSLYERLGEAFYAEAEYAKAIDAFQKALNKGGLKRPGDVIALQATANYELGNRDTALSLFKRCKDYPTSRRSCSGWETFIEGEKELEQKQEDFRVSVFMEECKIHAEDILGDKVLREQKLPGLRNDCKFAVPGVMAGLGESRQAIIAIVGEETLREVEVNGAENLARAAMGLPPKGAQAAAGPGSKEEGGQP